MLALAVGRRAFVPRDSSAGVVGASSFCFVSFAIPLVDVDFVVVVCCFDVWGPWSEAIGGVHLMGEAAAPLLVPNCFVGKDGGVPIVVPWELGSVSRWDTHGWAAVTPHVSMSPWSAWLVLQLQQTCRFARRHPWEHSPFKAQVRQTGFPLCLGMMSSNCPAITELMVEWDESPKRCRRPQSA